MYLLNRCPTKNVQSITHQDAWTRYKPNIPHPKIFGYIAYAQVPKPKRKKLDDHGEK